MPIHHPSLQGPPADLVGGSWVRLDGDGLVARNPARPGDVVWAGTPRLESVGSAVDAARAALPAWSRWPLDRRADVVRRYADLCRARESCVTDLITDQTGKALWDAKAEAAALAQKVEITLDASETGPLRRVLGYEQSLGPTRTGRCELRPHGVMAVVGPYNFPAHLPNGHIVPALLMGNTVVLKPSDKAPAVGQLLGELLLEALAAAGAPPGVVNVVQGGADVARALVGHDGVDGILFTGSWPVGRAILQANLDRPGRLIALEMGGNNPAVVLDDADIRQAVVECARSAFVTTGQRCTCTRRIIVQRGIADRFIAALVGVAKGLVVGDPRSTPPVFMGPIISSEARGAVLGAQAKAAAAGGSVLCESVEKSRPGGGWYLSPGVVRVDRFTADADAARSAGADVEVFGPLVKVAVVGSIDEAVEQANATRFGLAAAVFTRDEASGSRVASRLRAGCVNVNTGTAGASSKLPFGGLGLSGNHRPAGSWSLDYCAYPVAGLVERSDAAPLPPGMSFEGGPLDPAAGA